MTSLALRKEQKMTIEKQIEARVLRALAEYKVLRVKMSNKAALNQSGLVNLELFNPIVEDKEDAIKFELLDRAFKNALTEDEQEVIELKFLSSCKIKDVTLWTQLGIHKDVYYSFKKPAIKKLAKALGIC